MDNCDTKEEQNIDNEVIDELTQKLVSKLLNINEQDCSEDGSDDNEEITLNSNLVTVNKLLDLQMKILKIVDKLV
jgi:hypothetical protein|tara:strand:+ start:3826 stop:4050 length:225 start_codon:yes stop_codon:yes gene_type:complete